MPEIQARVQGGERALPPPPPLPPPPKNERERVRQKGGKEGKERRRRRKEKWEYGDRMEGFAYKAVAPPPPPPHPPQQKKKREKAGKVKKKGNEELKGRQKRGRIAIFFSPPTRCGSGEGGGRPFPRERSEFVDNKKQTEKKLLTYMQWRS